MLIESRQRNKQIARNTLLLYARMILTMAVSLYTSKIVLEILGVEDYGTYNVVGGIVSTLGFFIGAMSAASQRFLAYELGRRDMIRLRKTFNASLSVHIFLAIVVLILAETVGLWFVDNYLVIPDESMEAARWVYQFSIFSFLISIVQVPYNAAIVSHERMNIYAYFSILEVVLKLAIVFLLAWIAFDKLKLYAILTFSVTFLISMLYRIYVRKNFDESRFLFVRDRKLYRVLISYSGWNLFGSLAAIAKGQGINILLNLFFGPVVNAAQGIASQIQGAVQSFVGNFQVAVNPQIIKSFAADEKEYMTKLIFKSAKFSFFLVFFLSLPVILEINTILKIWLDIVPEHTNSFTVLILIVALIDCISGPLMTAIQATGKIKVYQITVGTLLILILPISYLFFKMGYSPETIFYVSIVIAIVALCSRLYITVRLLNISLSSFIREVLFKGGIVVVFSLLPLVFLRSAMSEDIVRFFVLIPSSLFWTATVIYFGGLETNERIFIHHWIDRFFYKLRYEKRCK